MQGGEKPEAAAIARLLHLCRGPDADPDAQLAAAEAALAIFWSQLAQLVGERGARAVFGRATRIARRQHPLARRVQTGDQRLEFAPLRSDSALMGDDVAAAVIEPLAGALVEVVVALVGVDMLQAVLGDVEMALARQAEPHPQAGSDRQEDSHQPEPRRSPDNAP